MKPLRILWTGTRELADAQPVRHAVLVLLSDDRLARRVERDGWVWVHGAARGLDSLVERTAAEFKAQTEPHPADWDAHGKAAGIMRNAEMAEFGADLCLAFPCPRSVGTWDMIRRAVTAGIPVRIYPVLHEVKG